MPCYDYPYYRNFSTNIYNPKRFPLYNAYDPNIIYPRCSYRDCKCQQFNIHTQTEPITECTNTQSKQYWRPST